MPMNIFRKYLQYQSNQRCHSVKTLFLNTENKITHNPCHSFHNPAVNHCVVTYISLYERLMYQKKTK